MTTNNLIIHAFFLFVSGIFFGQASFGWSFLFALPIPLLIRYGIFKLYEREPE